MNYIDGYLVPVPNEKKEAYKAVAEKAAPIFREYGATRVVETWGDDVPDGEVTDFRRAVNAVDGETTVCPFIDFDDFGSCGFELGSVLVAVAGPVICFEPPGIALEMVSQR